MLFVRAMDIDIPCGPLGLEQGAADGRTLPRKYFPPCLQHCSEFAAASAFWSLRCEASAGGDLLLELGHRGTARRVEGPAVRPAAQRSLSPASGAFCSTPCQTRRTASSVQSRVGDQPKPRFCESSGFTASSAMYTRYLYWDSARQRMYLHEKKSAGRSRGTGSISLVLE